MLSGSWRGGILGVLGVLATAAAGLSNGAPLVVERPMGLSSGPAESRFLPGELLLRLAPSARKTDLRVLAADHHLRSLRRISRRLDLYLAVFDGDAARTLALAKKLSSDPRVLYANPAYRPQIFEIPNDPFAIDDGNYADRNPDQFWLNWSRVYEGWDITKGTPEVTVAVIDTGVDLDHPDLAANIWRNPGEIDGNGRDDDGNGYVDDVVGWDWVGQQNGSLADALRCQLLPNSAFCQDNNPDVFAGDASVGDGEANVGSGPGDAGVFHGTHVAGIVAAVINNEIGVAGAAPRVRLMPLRVATPEGGVNPTGLLEAIEYAIDNGADVINLSLGIPADAGVELPGFEDICQAAFEAGTVVVAASGNGGRPDGTSPGVSAPASYTSTLAVGSCNTRDTRSRYSDFGGTGAQVDVCAYGGEINASFDGIEEAIWSTGVVSQSMADASPEVNPGDPVYLGAVGTSMATPEAAGLAALIRSLNSRLGPAEVFELIREGSRDMGAPGVDVETGSGVLDFETTLASVSTESVRVGN